MTAAPKMTDILKQVREIAETPTTPERTKEEWRALAILVMSEINNVTQVNEEDFFKDACIKFMLSNGMKDDFMVFMDAMNAEFSEREKMMGAVEQMLGEFGITSIEFR